MTVTAALRIGEESVVNWLENGLPPGFVLLGWNYITSFISFYDLLRPPRQALEGTVAATEVSSFGLNVVGDALQHAESSFKSSFGNEGRCSLF